MTKHNSHSYLPIADHGIIGDLHTVALVGGDGTIDWFCCPRFDAPSVFASILDSSKGGFFSVQPITASWKTKQLYIPDTNVLLTRFLTASGIGEVVDFMAIHDGRERVERHRLIRQVRCVHGEMQFAADVQPRFNYGRDGHELGMHEQGVVFVAADQCMALAAPTAFERHASGVRGCFVLREGQTATFTFGCVQPDFVPRSMSEQESREQFQRTVAYWRGWLSQSHYEGRWREMVHRSALTLKLLTYEPTGAIVAAATTSLPEDLGGTRNWDYRYTWVRDAAFTLYAFLRLGFAEETRAFMGWLADVLCRCHEGDPDHPPMQIMYGIDGRTELPETTLDHLEGYEGSAPVRIGNDAAGQLQLDIYGELVNSIYHFDKYAQPITRETWADIRRLIGWLCSCWNQPDEGVWEIRARRKHFTYSRLMSWVATDRAIRLARARDLPGDLRRWTAARDAIHDQIIQRSWNPRRKAFVQSFGSDVLDASTLMIPLVKFISPTDARWLSTLDAIQNELVLDTLVRRYNIEASPDGLAGSEATFSICSFWYVEALVRANRLEEARLSFEKMLSYSNHLGLYSEEIGPTGEQLGNFPQAFTHLALISAATTLDSALG